MCNKLLKQKKNVENRDRELAFLNALIHYLENRDDLKDPSPEFRKQKDFGLICDVIVLLCPLHPALVRGLPKDLKKDLSEYVWKKCDVQFGELNDYSNEKCADNLRRLRHQKEVQYDAEQQKLAALNEALQDPNVDSKTCEEGD